MNDLFGVAGSKPKLITSYTSGTGTYVPTENNARCLVRLQAGGGGGQTAGSAGGGGGAFLEFVVRVPIAGLAYVVGAGGAINTAGGPTSFGKISAQGGGFGTSGPTPGIGGVVGLSYGSADATTATITVSNTLTGVSGGGGGLGGQGGGRIGFPAANNSSGWGANPAAQVGFKNASGASSGGDSFYGTGGTNGNPAAAGNYGAGGGANAAGLGGYIEIWDYGV